MVGRGEDNAGHQAIADPPLQPPLGQTAGLGHGSGGQQVDVIGAPHARAVLRLQRSAEHRPDEVVSPPGSLALTEAEDAHADDTPGQAVPRGLGGGHGDGARQKEAPAGAVGVDGRLERQCKPGNALELVDTVAGFAVDRGRERATITTSQIVW